MTTFLLIRHATCAPVGRSLAGRAPGVALDAAGRRQAERLAARLAGARIDAVVASPLERARETARALAGPRGLVVEEAPGLVDLEFGEWTGREIAELSDDVRFRRFNTFRSGTRIPGGEHILDAQRRAVLELERLRERWPHADARIAAVSHADVIRSLIAWFVGVPIDLAHRLAIEPASMSVLALEDEGVRLVALNDVGDGP